MFIDQHNAMVGRPCTPIVYPYHPANKGQELEESTALRTLRFLKLVPNIFKPNQSETLSKQKRS